MSKGLAPAAVWARMYIVNNIAVTVHTFGSTLAAIQVVGVSPDRAASRALGSIDASWPEHFSWAMRAFDRGDFLVRRDGSVWFFEGEEAERLAEGE